MSDVIKNEAVVEEEAPKRPRRRKRTPKSDLLVIEHGLGSDETPLYERLEAALKDLKAKGMLYLTVPKQMAGDSLTSWLLARFSQVGPLNVGTNPKLTVNDPRTRGGFMCVK
jgi:hypothetical protein